MVTEDKVFRKIKELRKYFVWQTIWLRRFTILQVFWCNDGKIYNKTYWQEEISPWFHHVKGRSHADYDTLSRFRLSLPEAFLSWESPQTSSSPVSWTSLVQPFRGIEKGNCHPPCFVYQEGPAGQMHGNQFCWQYATSYLQKPEDTHSQGIQGHSPKGEMPLGWSFGGKLHLICNERGELLNFMITPGGVVTASLWNTMPL